LGLLLRCCYQGVPHTTTKKTQASITLSDALGGVTVLQKGETDIISFSQSTKIGGERETAEVRVFITCEVQDTE
jgi:hypothetical protein